MLFNLTLLIQMFNFWLAYQLIARGLLPLALKLLTKREQYAAELLDKQAQKQQALTELAQQRLDLAQQARTLFKPWLEQIQASWLQQYPVVPAITPLQITAAQLTELQTGLQQTILERLQHV